MKRIRFPILLVILAVVAFSVSGGGAAEAGKGFNVLFIAVDDLSTRLGCYGSGSVESPHIDALAARGVRFDRAYCQYPSCGPSRASVMTGWRPRHTGVLDNRTHFRERHPEAITLPQWFRGHGYHAARVGKVFHQNVPTDIGAAGLDDPASWDETVNPRGRDKDEEGRLTVYTPDLPLPDQMAYLKAEGMDSEQTDGRVADETIRLLKENAGRPFFLAAGFYRPHLPSIAPKPYFDLYSLENTPVPSLPSAYRDRVPAAALASTPVWPNFGVTEAQARECILAYEATVSFVDTQIGRVLAALDELKLADRTVVVLWGDHGYHLGEHGLWRKNSLFEESARAPLIVAMPGARGAGQDCRRLVEFVDIFPTTAEAAGLPLPEDLDGVSLVPLLHDPDLPRDRPAFTEVRFREVPGCSIRTDRWRYNEWGEYGSNGRELYDEVGDPSEMTNLAEDPGMAEVVESLSKELRSHFAP